MTEARHERAEGLPQDVAWVRRLARGLVGDLHLAEDLAQEALAVALERGGAPPEARRAWLGGVVRRLAARSRRGAGRRARRERAVARGEAEAGGAALVARAALHRDLVGHVMALEEPFRTALLLRYLEDLPPREIARRLGVPPRTVASRLARGRARLRERLDAGAGGREAWLPGVAALGGGATRGGGLLGGIAMGVKAKAAVAAACAAAAATAIVAVRAGLEDGAEAPARTAARGGAAGGAAGELALVEDAGGRAPVAPGGGAAGADAPAAGAAPAPLVLRGRVVDAACPELGIAEAPAPDVKLRVWTAERAFEGGPGFQKPAAEGTSRDGAFAIDVPDPGYRPVHVHVLAEGSDRHRGADANGVLGAGAPAAAGDDVVVVRPPFGVLHGRVRTPDGAPLPGARVSAVDPRDPAARVATTSDDAGAFGLASAGYVDDLRAELPGYALLESTPVLPLDAGGYRDVELVLAPAGRLLVRARDAAGRPAEGVQLAVRIAAEEISPGADGDAYGRSSSARTDARGLAALEGVWLGRKIVVSARHELGATSYDKVQEGRLVRAGAPGGSALVVPAHGLLEVSLDLPPEVVVRGTVRFPDGSAVPEPGFDVTTRGAAWEAARSLLSLSGGRGMPDGTFEARFPADLVEGPLTVIAVDGRVGGPWGAEPSYEHAARVDLDLADARAEGAERVLEAELVLAPTASISGRLVDDQGAPVDQGFGNRVYAVPAGAAHPFAPTALGREAWTHSKGGAFEITGLPLGTYDLYATREIEGFYSFSSGLMRVPDVAAGTTGLKIVVPRAGGVRVRLELELGGSEPPESLTVLVGALRPADGRETPPRSPDALRGDRPAAWPPNAPWDFTGASGAVTAEGRYQYGLYHTDEVAGHALGDLGEGWYVFGVVPRSGRRITHVPVGTEPAYLRPGDVRLTFALTPAAPLEGRVVSDAPVGHLAVALVDARGALLPQELEGLFSGRRTSTVPLDASGRFRIPVAPVGRVQLRVGTPHALERGEFERELEIEVPPAGAAERPPAEIRL